MGNIIISNDISASMSLEISNNTEGDNYSKSNMCNHTLVCILNSLLNSNVKVCLFNSEVIDIIDSTLITPDIINVINKRITNIAPHGGTDILKVLLTALNSISNTDADADIHILLLTDGESTSGVTNSDEILSLLSTTLDLIFNKIGKIPKIHTIGFGNQINSTLLYNISKLSKGIYTYVSDLSMIGNVVASCLSSMLIPKKIIDFNIKDHIIDYFVDFLNYVLCSNTVYLNSTKESNYQQLESLIRYYESIENDDFVSLLLLDLKNTEDINNGQIYKALLLENFNIWGKNYLYAVLSAYDNYIVPNNKDNATKYFKGENYDTIFNTIKNLFCDIIPPIPSVKNYATNNSNIPIPMNRIFNAGGCYGKDTFIKTNSQLRYTRISDLQKGDTVSTLDGIVEIEAVIKLKYTGKLYGNDYYKFTPWHPILINYRNNNEMKSLFPIENNIFDEYDIENEYVYDLVLKSNTGNRRIVELYTNIDYIRLFGATFGQTYNNEIFNHEFFGSEMIVDCLKRQNSYESGIVTIDNYEYIRNNETNIVIGMNIY